MAMKDILYSISRADLEFRYQNKVAYKKSKSNIEVSETAEVLDRMGKQILDNSYDYDLTSKEY